MNRTINCIVPIFWSLTSVLVLLYGIWYTSSEYQVLVDWYQNLEPNFYKNDVWSSIFFTSQTKGFGETYIWILFIMSLIVAISTRNIKLDIKTQSFSPINWSNCKVDLMIFMLGMLIWFFWQSRAAYATDEVFSAINFASKPFFQTISFYPLPNNHIFFNALNHWLSIFHDDLIWTGRVISGLSFSIILVRIWTFIGRFESDIFIKLVFILLLSTIFPFIGFATQARGYNLQLLLAWIAFEQVYFYLKTKDTRHLSTYVIVMTLGMWTIPSFLFYWIGLSVFVILSGKSYRTLDFKFIYASIRILILSLILYIPVVTFSGWQSVVANKYVAAPTDLTTSEFFQSFFLSNYFQGLFNEWFGSGTSTWLAVILIILPIGLVVMYKQKEQIVLLRLFLSLVFGFIAVSLIIKKIPFYRNVIIQCWFYWVILFLIIISLIKDRTRFWKNMVVLIMLTITIYFTFLNFKRYPFQLYYYDVNAWVQSMKDTDLSNLKNQYVFIEDESFYWHPQIQKVTKQTKYGGKIDLLSDILVIETTRKDKVDTLIWQQMLQSGETLFFKRRK